MHVLGTVVAVTGAAAGPAPYHHSGPIPGYLLHQPGQVSGHWHVSDVFHTPSSLGLREQL